MIDDLIDILILIALVLLFVFSGFFLAKSVDSPRKEFMQECMNDGKKKYECTAMWRGKD